MSYFGWSKKAVHALYEDENWRKAESQPVIDATSSGIQYAHSVIEGLKAYKTPDKEIVVFRLEDHFNRFCQSAATMNIPPIAYDLFMEAIKAIIQDEGQWEYPIASDILYLRPVIYGLDGDIFPAKGKRFGFSLYSAPVLSFTKEKSTIRFNDSMTRTSVKGLSAAKASLNYAPIIAQKDKNTGVTDVWYDHHTEEIEEADTSNIFFVTKDNLVITPPLGNRILAGVTRDSIIRIIKSVDPYEIIERKITLKDVKNLCKANELEECFTTSTGIGVQPANSINIDSRHYELKLTGHSLSKLITSEYYDIIFKPNEYYKNWRYCI